MKYLGSFCFMKKAISYRTVVGYISAGRFQLSLHHEFLPLPRSGWEAQFPEPS